MSWPLRRVARACGVRGPFEPTRWVWSRGLALLCDHYGGLPFVRDQGGGRPEQPLRPEAYVNVRDSALVWVRSTQLPQFVSAVLPQIRARFALLSGDEDWSIPSDFAGAAELAADDRVVCWFAQNCDARASRQQGENQWIRWTLHEDADLARARAPAEALELAPAGDAVVWSQLRQRLAWQYSFPAATRQPAKTSVSALRRQAAELGEEVVALVADDVRDSPASADTEGKPHRAEAGQPASSRGTAHHLFLQLVSLDNPGSVASLKQEAERLKACGAMTGEDTAQLDFDGLAAFWNSDLGGRILAHRSLVRRELAFTARLGPHQLAGLIGAAPEPGLEQEFVVVQGVADLVVLLPKEIWLLDFKTDQIGPGGIAGRAESYAPQLRLYAHALTQVYGRRVTERWLYFLAARQAVPIPS